MWGQPPSAVQPQSGERAGFSPEDAAPSNALPPVPAGFYTFDISLGSVMGGAAVVSGKPWGHWVGGALPLSGKDYRDVFFAPVALVFSDAVRGGMYGGWSGLKFVLR